MPVLRPCLTAAGAELANVMNEAAVQAIRRDAQSISQQDILNGMERILQVWHGLERLLLSSAGPTQKLPLQQPLVTGACMPSGGP